MIFFFRTTDQLIYAVQSPQPLDYDINKLIWLFGDAELLKEDKIFDRVISIKYDVENDRLDKFDDYKKAIDKFYDDVIARNA